MPPSVNAAGGAALAARMEAARGVIEARFLNASDILAEAVEGIAALVTALDELSAALSPETIAATTRQLAAAAAKLTALPGRQAERSAAIAILAAQRACLSEHTTEMRRSLAYMRAFTTSIKITAAGIPEANAEFGVFAQEISARVELGHAEVNALEHALMALDSELHAATQKTDSLAQGCAGIVPDVPDQLLASAKVMAAHRGQLAAAAADTAALARGVRKKTSRILAALQIGDITRQRVEHVQAGAAMLDAAEAGALPGVLSALLAAQLQAALDDFTREVGEIHAGLAGLARDAAALLGLRGLAYGEQTSQSGGFLRTLEQTLRAATGRVARIESAATLAQATGSTAAEAARILSNRLDAVQSMKSDVFFMAMNTTLKSARLGDAGLPLSTIATELRTYSDQLAVTASAAVLALQTLSETAAGLATEPAEGEGAGAALGDAIGQVSAAGSTTERDVATLAAQGEAVLTLLRRSTDSMALQSEIGDALREVSAALLTIAAGAQPCVAAQQEALCEPFNRLAALYTMAQERDVHAAIAAQYGVPAAAPPAPQNAAEEFEDALF